MVAITTSSRTPCVGSIFPFFVKYFKISKTDPRRTTAPIEKVTNITTKTSYNIL